MAHVRHLNDKQKPDHCIDNVIAFDLKRMRRLGR